MQGMSNKEYIKSRLSNRALLEQLAEEAAEVSQAALKVIRAAKSSENPTPVTLDEAIDNTFQELQDVIIVADVLGFLPDVTPDDDPKVIRWAERLRAKEAAENGGDV